MTSVDCPPSENLEKVSRMDGSEDDHDDDDDETGYFKQTHHSDYMNINNRKQDEVLCCIFISSIQ